MLMRILLLSVRPALSASFAYSNLTPQLVRFGNRVITKHILTQKDTHARTQYDVAVAGTHQSARPDGSSVFADGFADSCCCRSRG
jgi:hypothetical protein